MQDGWAAIELQDLDLGDARRTRRAIQLVEALALAPQASVPNACGSWAATKAAYRFWSNPEVTPAALRAAHTASAVRRMAGLDTVLVVQDTTDLDFTTQPAMAGRGKLAHPAQRGVFVHSGLAVSPEGIPLGRSTSRAGFAIRTQRRHGRSGTRRRQRRRRASAG